MPARLDLPRRRRRADRLRRVRRPDRGGDRDRSSPPGAGLGGADRRRRRPGEGRDPLGAVLQRADQARARLGAGVPDAPSGGSGTRSRRWPVEISCRLDDQGRAGVQAHRRAARARRGGGGVALPRDASRAADRGAARSEEPGEGEAEAGRGAGRRGGAAAPRAGEQRQRGPGPRRGPSQEEEGEAESVRACSTSSPRATGSSGSDGLDPRPGDVYVSASQIRRCELRAGDEVSGPAREPRRGGAIAP